MEALFYIHNIHTLTSKGNQSQPGSTWITSIGGRHNEISKTFAGGAGGANKEKREVLFCLRELRVDLLDNLGPFCFANMIVAKQHFL